MQSARITSAVAVFLLYPAIALADANDGDLFGFTLGAVYGEVDDKPYDDARLVLVATQSPVKPDEIETVYVLVTPVTRTIGKIAGEAWYETGEDAIVSYERFRGFLRDKYGNWKTEEQSGPQFQRAGFTYDDYTLSVQVSGPHRDNLAKDPGKPFQLVLSLSYSATSPSATEFELLASEEQKEAQIGQLAEDEVQGL